MLPVALVVVTGAPVLLVVHDSCLYWYGAPVELLLNVNVVLGAVPDVLVVYVFLVYYTPAGDLLSTSAFSPGVPVTTLLLVVVVVYVLVVYEGAPVAYPVVPYVVFLSALLVFVTLFTLLLKLFVFVFVLVVVLVVVILAGDAA